MCAGFLKRFDQVGHRKFANKLSWYGISGQTNEWIKNFLFGQTQYVVVDGCYSTAKQVHSGVPQALVHGPCLFLFYKRYCPRPPFNCSSFRWWHHDLSDSLQWERCWSPTAWLNTLSQCADTWMTDFHSQKCEVISIFWKGNPWSTHIHSMARNWSTLTWVKYLGVTITNDLRWDQHIDSITSKATNSLNFLRHNIRVSNTKVKQTAYKTLVHPLFEYSQTVWDPYTAAATKKLEAVQRRAARFVTNRYRRTSSITDMLSLLKWQHLEEWHRIARLTMFYKIHNNLVATLIPLQLRGHTSPTPPPTTFGRLSSRELQRSGINTTVIGSG